MTSFALELKFVGIPGSGDVRNINLRRASLLVSPTRQDASN
jgi:hypothetical protein